MYQSELVHRASLALQ